MRQQSSDCITRIATALKERRLLVFCGAGVSLESGLPTANEFLAELGIRTLPWQKGTSLLSQERDFRHKFQKRFNDPKLVPSQQHRLIASLDAPVCVTTNYDLLLERAHVELYGEDHVGVVRKPDHLRFSNSKKNLIIKLHGDVNDESLHVVTAMDYMARWRSPNVVDNFVYHLFATHTVLFIGYSLDDAHVLSVLDSQTQCPYGGLPDRFTLVRESDPERDKYLKTLCVESIVLDKSADFNTSICDFLFAVWERSVRHLAFSAPIKPQELPLPTRLEYAMHQRQQGNFAAVKQSLPSLTKEIIQKNPIDLKLLPGLLWLNVSLYDKLEDWAHLRSLDENFFQPAFQRIEETVAAKVILSLKAGYESAMAIALIRQGDFADAKRRANESIAAPCSENADSSLQIVFADALTTRAIALLGLWAEDKDPSHLETAKRDLDSAIQIFSKHGSIGLANESHHLGRYYGTSALLEVAKATARCEDLARETDAIERIRTLAKQAHTGTNRTSFGKIAGQWCHAFCCYKISACENLPPEIRQKLIAEGEELLRTALSKTSETQSTARLKIRLLQQRLANLAGHDVTDADTGEIENLRGCVPQEVRKVIDRISEDRWLHLPLN